jgi:hypothetical protein
MKTSSIWNLRSIVGKIMMVLVLATMIGSMEVAPALARDDYNRGGRHDDGRYDNRGRGHDGGRYEHRGRGYDRGRYVRGGGVYRSYGYREPVYYPPPVYYEPPPPPGIGVFFPPIFIH